MNMLPDVDAMGVDQDFERRKLDFYRALEAMQ